MDKLIERIKKEGITLGSDRINVQGFLNHKIDSKFLDEIGAEFGILFSNEKVDKILTIESSGIAIASFASKYFNYCDIVFAKKAKSNILDDNLFVSHAMSFTKKQLNDVIVNKDFLKEGENILILDDFLAHGEASMALVDLCSQAKCNVVGIGICISKDFQGGKEKLEKKGLRVETLASVTSIENGMFKFK